jgi:hypothetical protein
MIDRSRRNLLKGTAGVPGLCLIGHSTAVQALARETSAPPVGWFTYFPLSSVRLGSRIFQDQEDINARYLDSLAVDRLLHSLRITTGISSGLRCRKSRPRLMQARAVGSGRYSDGAALHMAGEDAEYQRMPVCQIDEQRYSAYGNCGAPRNRAETQKSHIHRCHFYPWKSPNPADSATIDWLFARNTIRLR